MCRLHQTEPNATVGPCESTALSSVSSRSESVPGFDLYVELPRRFRCFQLQRSSHYADWKLRCRLSYVCVRGSHICWNLRRAQQRDLSKKQVHRRGDQAYHGAHQIPQRVPRSSVAESLDVIGDGPGHRGWRKDARVSRRSRHRSRGCCWSTFHLWRVPGVLARLL